MAVFVAPRKWTAAPPVGTSINWGHPLADRLLVCYLFNQQGGYLAHNIARNIQDALPQTNSGWSPLGFRFAAGGTVSVTPGAVTIPLPVGEVALRPGTVDVTPGAVTVPAPTGVLALASGALTVEPGAITITLPTGTIELAGGVVIPAPSITLDVPIGVLTVGSGTLAPGPRRHDAAQEVQFALGKLLIPVLTDVANGLPTRHGKDGSWPAQRLLARFPG